MDELQQKILSYKPSHEAKRLLKESKPLLLVGPTGSGKNTIEKQLVKTGKFKAIVSHTTRPPRINHGVLEQEGQELHFISRQEAMAMLDKQEFIEAAYTHGHLYGTSVKEFKIANDQSKIPVADIDVKGVKAYRQLSDKITAVFLLPPSFQVLVERVINRYGESRNPNDIKVRLATALDELYELFNTDYYYAVINERIEETTKKVLDIISGKVNLEPNKEALSLAQKIINDIKDYLLNQAD